MKLATWHWHIEISSKCTLKCSRCAREEVPDTLVNTELKLDFFKKNFTPEFILSDVEKITLCGDDGDPIYANDLIDVIEYIKSVKPVKFVIVTNGSYKKADWWKRLGTVLDKNDHIHFSLDGWDQLSNEQYRVNSNWESIMLGVKTLRQASPVYMTWDCIVFKFNENMLDSMEQQAQQLGFDEFQITRSTKFNKVYSIYPENDPLQPSESGISDKYRFTRELHNLSGRLPSTVGYETNVELYNKSNTYKDIKPLCGIGNKGLFLNSQGHLFPCCWVANRYNHNNEWIELGNSFNLNKRALTDVLNDDFWKNQFENFHWSECKAKCNIAVVDFDYSTEW